MASLFKRDGSPFWWLFMVDGGERKRFSTGIRHEGKRKPCEAAEKIRLRYEQAQAFARHGVAMPVEVITLQDFFKALAATETCRPSSAIRYAITRKNFREWAESQRVTTVAAVTSAVAARYLADCLAEKAPVTVKNEFGLLAKDWVIAKDRNYCAWEKNPFEASIKVEAEEKEPLKQAEIERVLGVTEPDWFPRATRIGLATGARIASVWALEWQYVSFDLGTIAFKVSKTKPWVVPMHPSLRAYLEPLRQQDGYVLGQNRPSSPARMSEQYIRASQVAGARVNFHRFRHTLTTMMATSGVDKRHAMAIINHTSEGIHNHYTHVEASRLVSVMAKVAVGF